MFSFNKDELDEKEAKLYNEYNLTEEELSNLKKLINEYKDKLEQALKTRNNLINEKEKKIYSLTNMTYLILLLIIFNIILGNMFLNLLVLGIIVLKIPTLIDVIKMYSSKEIEYLEHEVKFLFDEVYSLECKKGVIETKLRNLDYYLENINVSRQVLEDINMYRDEILIRKRKVIG